MNYILFDSHERNHLLPFAHTRAVADIRCGILTMRERWELLFGAQFATLTMEYIQPIYPELPKEGNTVYINGAVHGNANLVQQIAALHVGQVLVNGRTILAAKLDEPIADRAKLHQTVEEIEVVEYKLPVEVLNNNWDIFSQNEQAIRHDYILLTHGRTSESIPQGVTVIGSEAVFLEAGAKIMPGTIINAQTGPVYVGAGAEIMEGCMVRGPLAMGAQSVLKMGAKVYGGTTIGPGCKVGGEVSNVVFMANSNKGHDGFLGNAVVGEWCNLGADTNCSNLKNNYDVVKIWSEAEGKNISTGLTFCGLMMGDHSKCGINTMFNTGTVVGVSCNIYGGDFLEKFVPNFSWGGSDGFTTYQFDKAMNTAQRMMARRGKNLTVAEMELYRYLYNKATSK